MWEPQGNSQTVQLFLGACSFGDEGKAGESLEVVFSFLLSLKLFPWDLRSQAKPLCPGFCSYSLNSPLPFLLGLAMVS